VRTNGASSSPGSFVIEDRPEGRALVVTGPWSDKIERALVDAAVTGLDLNYARGYRERDLEFLDDWPVRRLHVLDRRLTDLGPVSRLSALEELRVETAPTAPIHLGELPGLTRLAADWTQIGETLPAASGLRRLLVGGYQGEDLGAFESLSKLEHLELQQAPRLRSLAGAGQLPSLAALRVFLARKLRDFGDVGERGGSLRELELEDCPAITQLDGVEQLVGLRFLGVSDCGDIKSLAPVDALDQLEELDAWGSTRIVDGDLSPLAQLPRLREIRMRDRRAYKPRVADLVSVEGRRRSGAPDRGGGS
jgi:hypothetical protein